MVGNRLLTDALREVRKSLSRFLSLFVLSALAVAFFAGLRTTAPDMEHSADRYFDALTLMDLRVISTLGLTDADVAVLASQSGIARAEGAYAADALVHLAQNDLIIKLHSLSPSGINAPALLSGRLPENDRECVVEPKLLASSGMALGDTISFDTGEGSFEDALRHDSYTVVGTVNSPLYISVERGSSSLGAGRVAAFAMVPHNAFQMDTYTDAYLLAADTQELLCYSEAYEDKIDALALTLEPLSDQRAALRYDEVIGEATDTLNDAQQELDDAEVEVAQELEDARLALEDGRRELDDGWRDYRDGEATLTRESADARRQIADAEVELADAQQTLLDAQSELEDARLDVATGKQELEDARLALEDGEVAYADGLADWQEGKRKYDEGVVTWQEGKATYDESRQTLTEGQRDYEDGLRKYEDGLVQLQNGAGQLSAAKKKLDTADRQLDAGYADLNSGTAQYEAGKAQFDGQVGPLAQGISAALGMTITPDALLDLLANPPDPTDPRYPLWLGILATLPEGEATANLLVATRTQLQQAKAQLDAGSAALSSGYRQYKEGLKTYKEGLATFEQSVLDLQAAQVELDDAKIELDDGWVQLAAGKLELDDGWNTLEESALQLSNAAVLLEEAKAELADGWTKYEEGVVTYEDGLAAYQSGVADYEDGLVEYEDGKAALAQAKTDFSTETAKASRKLADALVELEDGEATYADGLVEYEDGKREADTELSDARRKLNDARREIADIEDCQWYVLSRSTNIGYVSYQQDAERMGNLASVFPLIFFLVAALVCLTTMTRMVEEQRVQIGGMKALGYGKGAIALKYVGYGFLASFLGGVVGLVVGCLSIPTIIFTAWGALYSMGELVIPFYPVISALAVGAAVLCVTGTALATVFTTLHAVPAQLMRPRTPKPGKRVLLEHLPVLWSRLSFTWKVTLRNLFRYKKRFLMTVVGIGGCAALIVTGFGIRDSILDTLNNQYDRISTYSSEISLDDKLTDAEYQEISGQMDGFSTVDDWMPCYTAPLTAEGAKRSMDASLFAVEDVGAFDDFIHLRHRLDEAPVTLPDDGAVLTEKLAEMLGVTVGDTITLDGDTRVQVLVADIAENYILHYVYVSAAYYESLYGAPPPTNVLLARYNDESKPAADAISSSLISLSGVGSVNLIRETRTTFAQSLESVDYAVIVVIIAAAALAFVVLFNLTNINITERMRELATLKVLGFYDGELSSYVYRENVFLTIFGVGLGLVMGKFLHQWLVLTVEIDMVMFGRTAHTASYLYAAGLTLLFSLLVNLAARKRLKNIDMVESLKTVE